VDVKVGVLRIVVMLVQVDVKMLVLRLAVQLVLADVGVYATLIALDVQLAVAMDARIYVLMAVLTSVRQEE
jgi:hypothetical protein